MQINNINHNINHNQHQHQHHINELRQTVNDFEKAVAELAVNVLSKRNLQKALEGSL